VSRNGTTLFISDVGFFFRFILCDSDYLLYRLEYFLVSFWEEGGCPPLEGGRMEGEWRMEGGWREDGGRMEGGWKDEDGGRMQGGWKEDGGGRLEAGGMEGG
jgi:hypothetical protein